MSRCLRAGHLFSLLCKKKTSCSDKQKKRDMSLSATIFSILIMLYLVTTCRCAQWVFERINNARILSWELLALQNISPQKNTPMWEKSGTCAMIYTSKKWLCVYLQLAPDRRSMHWIWTRKSRLSLLFKVLFSFLDIERRLNCVLSNTVIQCWYFVEWAAISLSNKTDSTIVHPSRQF
jgi:hypothetical protein